MRLVSKHLLPLLMVAATAVPAAGQTVEITPFVGGFIPTGRLGSIQVSNLPISNTLTVKGEMVAKAIFGGRIAYRGKGRLGAEATYLTGTPDMRVAVGGLNQNLAATLDVGSLKLVYQATSEQSGTDLFLSGGLMGIRHSGKAFSIGGAQTDLGGAVGGGLRIAMSPVVSLRFDGDLLLYRFQAAPLLSATLQHDFVMTAGLAIRLGR